MESKPMLFCDTTTVLTYMEANFRFNLALKIPSIRKAEKAAPLFINSLELYDSCLYVNRKEYKIRAYRQCQANVGLHKGEVFYDFDEFGYTLNLADYIEPGDVKFFGNKCRLKDYGLKNECPEKKKISIPCNHSIRLYVSDTMYELPYKNMKIYQLMKRLLTIFIGNRRGEWIIKNFRPQDNVLRWPVETRKPIVQNFEICTYTHNKLNGLQPIIDSSVPIPILKMSFSNGKIQDHPLFKNVEHLMICNHVSTPTVSDLFSIQTPIVTLTSPATLDTFLGQLINIFMEKPRPIGVRYSILVKKKINLNTINHPKEIRKYKDAIRLAMGSDAIAVVRYSKRRSKTWLIIEVVAKN
ncbi:hypothetical protein B9Z55_000186 [Caenorhabditis nigoni]|uniref:DUF38 domain-containing protein n=1 Tax=Caenorhabditis nigoni TaxID=1611254 RepID=A0A2G5VHM6_9PELO|nr:hypothetical protein B9Z55_000186 [Caenorhabditis nigoni]